MLWLMTKNVPSLSTEPAAIMSDPISAGILPRAMCMTAKMYLCKAGGLHVAGGLQLHPCIRLTLGGL